jgi:hypothetical protein
VALRQVEHEWEAIDKEVAGEDFMHVGRSDPDTRTLPHNGLSSLVPTLPTTLSGRS